MKSPIVSGLQTTSTGPPDNLTFFRTILMVIEDKLQELKEQINKIVPSGITISDVEFEGT
jgi:hypothetical protein